MAKQVLVIDDDQNTVKYLSVLLREHGYDPVSACDGNEGLQKVREAKPDLIVLDVKMPKRSGLVVFKELKRDEQYKDIPILMLTGVSAIIDELESHKDETFEKPYDELRETLKKKIQEMREEGLVRPEMFVDKPVDADSFVTKVRELIGS
ncbi:MAG: response regulator [Planctomycetota bacterium]|jgi:CheY-like chemotaxis protein